MLARLQQHPQSRWTCVGPKATLATAMKKYLPLLLLIIAALCAYGEDVQAIPGLSRYKLANGLEVYGYRDAAVPLARVQIVFKTGALRSSRRRRVSSTCTST